MYCPFPYGSIHINPNGRVRPCCRFNGFLVNDQKDLNLKNIFFGQNMTNLRKKFDVLKKEDFIESCFRCYNEEKLGTKSLRDKYPYEIKETKLEMIELLFSNVCNFKCRTCNSFLSVRWQNDEKYLADLGFKDREVFKKYELINVDYNGIDTIRNVKITGGEPFLYKGIGENLKEIVENNKECDLSIYTNGSIFPDQDIINTMKKFKNVMIGVSVDGYENVNEYIRYGSVWNQTKENIEKFKACGFNVFLVTVISAYSLPRLKELLDWWGPGKHIFIYLQKPPYININVLSRDVLNNSINDLNNYNLPFISTIKNSKLQDNSRFKLYTQILDELRNQDYESIC